MSSHRSIRPTLRRTLIPILSAIALLPSSPSLAQPSLAQPLPATEVTRPIAPSQQPTASIAQLLPADTPGVFFINTHPDRWEALRQFGLFPADTTFPGFLYPTESGLNYDNDVKPWLGDQIGIVLLPATSSSATNPLQNTLIITTSKDIAAAERYLDRLKTTRKQAPLQQQYKGVTLLEWQPEDPIVPAADKPPEKPQSPNKLKATASKRPAAKPSTTKPAKEPLFAKPKFAIALVADHVVTAPSIAAIQQLLDTQPNASLATQPQFQQLVQDPKYARSLFVGYGDYREIVKKTMELNKAQLAQLPPGTPKIPVLDPLEIDLLGKFYDKVTGYLWVEADGIHFQTGINFQQKVPDAILQDITTRNQILDKLPDLNYMAANGQNLAIFWQAIITGLEAQPQYKQGLDQFRQVSQTLVGFDDRDLMPWMNGEVATFIYPTRKGFLPATLPNFDLAAGMMIQTRDRAAAEAALKKIDRSASRLFGKSVKLRTQKRSNQPSTTWNTTVGGQSVNFFSHSWVSADTLLFLVGGGDGGDFTAPDRRGLTQTAHFRSAIRPLPESNLGYAYFNGSALMSFFNTAISPLVFGKAAQSNPVLEQTQAALGTIRSFGTSSYITPEKLESQGFLSLAATRRKLNVNSELAPRN